MLLLQRLSCLEVVIMVRLVSVVGTRYGSFSPGLVSRVVFWFASRGWSVATGGALGVDFHVLSALLLTGLGRLGVVFAPWFSLAGFPVSVRPLISALLSAGGCVVWGLASPGASRRVVLNALFSRSSALVRASRLVVVFLSSASGGSWFCVREAVRLGRRVVVFSSAGCPPALPGGRWVVLRRGVLADGWLWVNSQSSLFVKKI